MINPIFGEGGCNSYRKWVRIVKILTLDICVLICYKSFVHIKKHLSFTALRKMMSTHFQRMSEYRQKGKIRHRLHDVFMSGFAMMVFQDPSILQFQKRLEEGIHNNNLRTLFQVTSVFRFAQCKALPKRQSDERCNR